MFEIVLIAPDTNSNSTKIMAKFNTKSAPHKRAAYINAWQEFAADESFAGMTLAEFEAVTLPAVTVREEIEQCLVKLAGLRRQRGAIDHELRTKLKLVVNAVRGNPDYGEDCPMYKAIGYVPSSERASGLHRGQGTAPSPTASNEPDPTEQPHQEVTGEVASPDVA